MFHKFHGLGRSLGLRGQDWEEVGASNHGEKAEIKIRFITVYHGFIQVYHGLCWFTMGLEWFINGLYIV